MTTPAPIQSSQLITVENRQTTLGPRDRFNAVWALSYAILFHYGRSPWVVDGHAPHAHVVQLPQGANPPAGAWNLILLDNATQQGALGFHDDENGKAIPYSEVFVLTAVQDGVQASAVMMHEAVEMLVDPHVVSPWVEPNPADAGKQFIVEPGDPVQGNDFDVGAPEGRTTGVQVADFAYPAWWGLKQTKTKALSFRESVSKPFEVATQGYISWLPAGADPGDPGAPWGQTFGSERKTAELPPWASRLPRIHGRPGV